MPPWWVGKLQGWGAEGWSWQHSSCSGLMILAAYNVLLVCCHVIAPSSNSKVEFQFQSVECHTNHWFLHISHVGAPSNLRFQMKVYKYVWIIYWSFCAVECNIRFSWDHFPWNMHCFVQHSYNCMAETFHPPTFFMKHFQCYVLTGTHCSTWAQGVCGFKDSVVQWFSGSDEVSTTK